MGRLSAAFNRDHCPCCLNESPAALRFLRNSATPGITMHINQLIERRNKLWADASALVAETDVTAEQRTQFDAMLSDVAVIDADINRLKAVEQYQNEQRSIANNSARPSPGESNDSEERAEVRNARIK